VGYFGLANGGNLNISVKVHGHTHESFDYEIGKTRVVCNPRGYASIEENRGFRPDFTVEV
jgi:predicted phosphodiesterase